jgi:hypothetical protein
VHPGPRPPAAPPGELGAGPALADRLWLVVEALYAVADRPDAEHQAEVAVALAADLLRPAA